MSWFVKSKGVERITNEEAIENLKGLLESNYVDSFEDTENKALEMAIKALDQKPCNTDTCKVVKAYMNEWDKPITAEPKVGHWIFFDKAHEHAHCSECDYGNVDLLDGRPHNYCPNCGCRMFEPQERSDKE